MTRLQFGPKERYRSTSAEIELFGFEIFKAVVNFTWEWEEASPDTGQPNPDWELFDVEVEGIDNGDLQKIRYGSTCDTLETLLHWLQEAAENFKPEGKT